MDCPVPPTHRLPARPEELRTRHWARGRLSRNAAYDETTARVHAQEAAHARRDLDGEARIVRVLYVAEDGTETLVATYEGDQLDDE